MGISAKRAASAAAKFLSAQTSKWWNSLGIYPQALAERAKFNELLADARTQVTKLGI